MDTLITPPVDEPISLLEMRMHLRNPEITTNDAEILEFISVAREYTEDTLGIALITQTREVTHDAFPSYSASPYGEIYLRSPVQSVTYVKYLDADAALTTLATTEYLVDAGTPGRLRLANGKLWPVPIDQQNAVTIRYVAGWSDVDAVPATIKAYIRLFVTSLYEHRKPEIVGSIVNRVPWVDRLIDHYRTHPFA